MTERLATRRFPEISVGQLKPIPASIYIRHCTGIVSVGAKLFIFRVFLCHAFLCLKVAVG